MLEKLKEKTNIATTGKRNTNV